MFGALAQSEECALCKREVRGSKPRCSRIASPLFSFYLAFPKKKKTCGLALAPSLSALVAQLVEHGSNKPRVGGSSPSWSISIFLLSFFCFFSFGRVGPAKLERHGVLAQSEACVLSKHEVLGSKPRYSTFDFWTSVWSSWL